MKDFVETQIRITQINEIEDTVEKVSYPLTGLIVVRIK